MVLSYAGMIRIRFEGYVSGAVAPPPAACMVRAEALAAKHSPAPGPGAAFRNRRLPPSGAAPARRALAEMASPVEGHATSV
jgi:hypothetical protein